MTMATTVDQLRAAIAALDFPGNTAVWFVVGEKVYLATGAARFPQVPEFRIVRRPPVPLAGLSVDRLVDRLDAAVDRGGAEWPVMLHKNTREIDAGFYALDFVSTQGDALFCIAEL